ncbi:hypothetical protein [Hymenobacter wooponensis]|uniref:Uncharacterized protein n=1 Tax=Hymenobacter wooponensis TaxID=1525360 RepID=A0A4Z0MVK1_9BACT|nr:hypothetical protein [Hymenobacter wooponensis]TGD83257.1 hypothetical protein EU557_05615 [Hymenobacter wooponensis]
MRVKVVLGLLSLLTLSVEVTAQVPVAPIANRALTRADTLQALHSLYQTKRRTGKVMTGLAGATLGTAVYSGAQVPLGGSIMSPSRPDERETTFATVAMVSGLAGIGLAIFGVDTWSQHTEAHEREAVALIEQRKALPKHVQRQLHHRLRRLAK